MDSKLTLQGKFLDFSTTCLEFRAINYDPTKDPVIISLPELGITELGIVRGWHKDYADELVHVAFSYIAMPGTRYAGTAFGGMSITKTLLNKLKEEYGWQTTKAENSRVTRVRLNDYDRYHKEFLTFCETQKLEVLGWCYGEYLVVDCPKNLPFWTDSKCRIQWYGYDRDVHRDVIMDAMNMSAVFLSDARFIARYYAPKGAHTAVISANNGYLRLDTINL